MVKSIAYTLTAIALCIGLFIFTELYLHNQFNEFHDALNALYTKIEDETATRSDALAVKAIWDDKKESCTFLYRTTIFPISIIGLTRRADCLPITITSWPWER